jgi:Prokaryotic E2 family D
MSVIITLKENHLPHVAYEVNGLKQGKHLHHDQLLDYIKDSIVEEGVSSSSKITILTPSMPTNTIKYGEKANGTSILFVAEPQISVDVKYHKETFKEVPYPKMVFCYVVRKERISDIYVACYKDLFLRDTTELFHFPYSNVHSDTKLCYYDRKQIEDLVQLQTFPHIWRSTDNNDHLYHQGASNLLNKPLREIFSAYSGQKFDNSIMKPMDKDFGTWANQLLNR